MSTSNVVILNGDYSFMGFTSWKRAVLLLELKKAEVVKNSDKFVTTMGGKIINIPIVLRLIKFIRILYKKEVPFSKKNILIRDGYVCQFCGIKLTDNIKSIKDSNYKKMKATIDHLKPVSKGGLSSWENCVCSCFKCNNDKGNRNLSETDLKLAKKPHKPTISEFIKMKLDVSGNKFDIMSLWS